MSRDALSRLVEVVASDHAPEVLSNSSDGRVVAAFGGTVAKLGLPGESVRTAAIMQAVGDQLTDDSPLVVPRVLWVRDDVLAMERLAGESYRTVVTGREATAAMQAVGRAAAALHDLRPPALALRHLGDHLDELIRPHPNELATTMPQLGRRIVSLIERLAAELPEPSAPSAIHRDLHLGQLFTAGERVAVIDWDLAALGDPALDLGNLRAYLRMRFPSATELWPAFAAGYGKPFPAHVADYEALMYVRMASKTFRLQGAAAVDRIESLLTAAEAIAS
jgi:aminoglycoside phosphotransferase (APT) family kinase protein